MPKYSICITNYNCGSTIGRSLHSIQGQLDERFEVVVVDNLSTDISRQLLRESEADGKLKLIETRCSIGKGLQIALENATGEYIISGMDLGETYKPRLTSFLEFYHSKCEGRLLKTRNEAIIVAPRSLIENLGGWRDLQRAEGWDLWSRAAKADLYLWTVYVLSEVRDRSSSTAEIEAHPERKNSFGMFRHRYAVYRDGLRVGRRLFAPGSHVSPGMRLAQVLALASLPLYTSYESGPSDFNPYDRRYFVDSRDWWLEEATRNGDNLERERLYYRNHLGITL